MTLFRNPTGGFVHRGKGTRVTVYDFWHFEALMHQWSIDNYAACGGHLIHHTQRPDKQTSIWSVMLGHQQGGTSKGFAGPVWMVAADVDKGELPPLEEIPARLGTECFAHESYNRGYHVFVPLTQPIGPEYMAPCLAWLNERLGGDCVNLDAKNVNRTWAVPAGSYRWVSGEGPPLDPGRFGLVLKPPKARQAPPREATAVAKVMAEDARLWINRDIEGLAEIPAGEGTRNSTVNKLVFRIAGLAAALALPEAELERLQEAIAGALMRQAAQYPKAAQADTLADSLAVAERAFDAGSGQPRDLSEYAEERMIKEITRDMRRLRAA